MKRVILAAFVSLFAASALAQGQSVPKYAAKVPPSIQTPDTVQTRIGTLKFFDGLPDDDTVQKVYDNLDFGRGVESFHGGHAGGLDLCLVPWLHRGGLYAQPAHRHH